jgi:hypothetical protein
MALVERSRARCASRTQGTRKYRLPRQRRPRRSRAAAPLRIAAATASCPSPEARSTAIRRRAGCAGRRRARSGSWPTSARRRSRVGGPLHDGRVVPRVPARARHRDVGRRRDVGAGVGRRRHRPTIEGACGSADGARPRCRSRRGARALCPPAPDREGHEACWALPELAILAGG